MDESTKTIEICQLLKKELLDNGYKYGFYLRDRCVTPNISLGFDEEFLGNRIEDSEVIRCLEERKNEFTKPLVWV